MIRAIIYCRVSTDAQRENYSIPAQIKACQDFIAKKQYALVGDHFVDPVTGKDCQESDNSILAFVDDFSGEDYPRPATTAALDYFDRFGFEVVVTWHPDRLARDPYAKMKFIFDFKELRGINLEYVEGGFDSSPEGELASDIMTLFARQENRRRVVRSKAGKVEKANRGLFVAGRSPFGYKINKVAPGGLEIVSDQADTIKRIYGLFLEGSSIRAIAKRLNIDRTPSYFGRGWQKSSIARILGNEIYTGRTYYQQRMRVKNPSTNKTAIKKRPQTEWIEINGITPIIEKSVWLKAKALLQQNSETKRQQPIREYLLNGMLFCEYCHKPYYAQTQKAGYNRRITDSQAYRHRKSEGHCMNRTFAAIVLDDAIWEMVRHFLVNPELLRQGYEEVLANNQLKFQQKRERLEFIEKKIQKLGMQKQNLLAAYTDPEIGLNKTDFIAQKSIIDKTIEDLSDEKAGINQILENIPTSIELENLESFAAEIGKKLKDYQPSKAEIKQLFKQMNLNVYINATFQFRLTGFLWEQDLSSNLYL